MSAYLPGQGAPACGEWNLGCHFADVMEQGGHFKILKLGFTEAEFLSDAQAPSARRVLCTPVLRSFKSRSWLNAQITELRSAAACSSSCLMRRDSSARWKGTVQRRWNGATGHGSYRQNNKQVPDVEPELFTQAETA